MSSPFTRGMTWLCHSWTVRSAISVLVFVVDASSWIELYAQVSSFVYRGPGALRAALVNSSRASTVATTASRVVTSSHYVPLISLQTSDQFVWNSADLPGYVDVACIEFVPEKMLQVPASRRCRLRNDVALYCTDAEVEVLCGARSINRAPSAAQIERVLSIGEGNWRVRGWNVGSATHSIWRIVLTRRCGPQRRALRARNSAAVNSRGWK